MRLDRIESDFLAFRSGARRALPFLVKIKWLQWRNATVHEMFDSTANKHPNKVCFYYEDQEWTFRHVQELSNRVGNYFQSRGYVKGDTVGLFMENRPEYLAIWMGLAKVRRGNACECTGKKKAFYMRFEYALQIGVIPALINYNLRRKPLQHSLEAATCKGLIYGVEVANGSFIPLVAGLHNSKLK